MKKNLALLNGLFLSVQSSWSLTGNTIERQKRIEALEKKVK
jgi:hypothetical protein